MRSMKRILATVLALTMIFVLATTASAATFKDSGKITHKDAVELLYDLGIVEGYTNGEYGPENSVTRAEMATMMCRLLLGDKFTSVAGNLPANTLKDAKGHWAEKYISYCHSIGIINGYPDGKFLPENPVTTAEAATMLLKALGYNKENEFAKNWEVVVMSEAYAAGLLTDLAIASATKMNRDQTAQMVYNTLFAQTKTHTLALGYINNGTIAHSVYGIEKVEGEITGVGENCVYIDGVKYEGVTTNFTYVGLKGSLYAQFKTNYTVGALSSIVTVDTSKLVKVISKEVSIENTVLAKSDDGTAFSALTDKSSDDYVATLERGEVSYYLNGEETSSSTATRDLVPGDMVVFIDNDNDRYADVVSVFKYGFGKVTSFNTSKNTVTIGDRTFKKDNVIGFADLKKNDYVYYYESNGDIYAYVAEMETGKVNNYKTENRAYTINGKTHRASGRGSYISMDVGNTYDIYYDANGYILYVDMQEKKAEYFYGIDNSAYNVHTKMTEAVVIGVDGKERDITIDGIGSGTSNYKVSAGAIAGNLYSYEKNKDGSFHLTPVGFGSGWYGFTNGSIYNDGIVADLDGDVRIDNDTLFIDVKDGKTYVGYKNVPSMVDVEGWVLLDSDYYNCATVVFIGERETTLTNDFFVLYTLHYERDAKYKDEYIYTVVIDGVKDTLIVDASTHEKMQENGVGCYYIASSADDVVTDVDVIEFYDEWARIFTDRNGVLESTAVSARKNSDTKYVLWEVNAKKATVGSYDTVLAKLAEVEDLVGQMAIITTDITGRYAETVVIVTDYTNPVTTKVEFLSEKAIGQDEDGAFYVLASDTDTVTMKVTALPGTEVSAYIDGHWHDEIVDSEDGYVTFDVSDLIGADGYDNTVKVCTLLGMEEHTKLPTLTYYLVYEVTFEDDTDEFTLMLDCEDETGLFTAEDDSMYAKKGADIEVSLSFSGTYADSDPITYTPAKFCVNATTIDVEDGVEGLSIINNVAEHTYTARYEYVIEEIAADTTITVGFPE